MGIVEFLKKFLPLFLVSAVLPVFLFAAMRPQTFSFLSSAGGEPELRVWLEPANVVTQMDVDTTFDILVEFERSDSLITYFGVNFLSDPSLVLSPSYLEYKDIFKGRGRIGQIKVRPSQRGVYSLSVDPENLEIGFLDDVSVVAGAASIVVQ